MAQGPQRFGGSGGGGARTTVLLSGSPFDTLALLETYSQANPDELLNNSTEVALAVVTADPTPANNGTYEYSGQNGVYQADRWVMFSGLDAADIKNLYESNPDTNAYDNSDLSTVGEVQSLTIGQIPMGTAGGVSDSPARFDSGSGMIKSTAPIQLPGGGALQFDNNDMSSGGTVSGGASGVRFTNLTDDTTGYLVNVPFVAATGSGAPFYDKFGAEIAAPSLSNTSDTRNAAFDFINPLPGIVTEYTVSRPAGSPTLTDCNFIIWLDGYETGTPLFDFKESNPGGAGFTLQAGLNTVTPPVPIGFPANIDPNSPDQIRLYSHVVDSDGNLIQLDGQEVQFPPSPDPREETVWLPYLERKVHFSEVIEMSEKNETDDDITEAENINNAIRFTRNNADEFDVTTSPFTRAYPDLGQGITPGGGSISLTNFRAAWMEFHPDAVNATAINIVSDIDNDIVFSMDSSKLTQDVALTITQANTVWSTGGSLKVLRHNHVLTAFCHRDIPTAPASPTNPNVIYAHQAAVDGDSGPAITPDFVNTVVVGANGDDNLDGTNFHSMVKSMSRAMTLAAGFPSGQHKLITSVGENSFGNFTNSATVGNVTNLNVDTPYATYGTIDLADHATSILCRRATGGMTIGDQCKVRVDGVVGSVNPSLIQFNGEVHEATVFSCQRLEATAAIDFSRVNSGSHIRIEVDRYDGSRSNIDNMLSAIPSGVTVTGFIGDVDLSSNYLKNSETYSDFTTQSPTGTDAPMVVKFGAGGTSSDGLVTMSSAGVITINKGGPFAFPMRAHVGRSGNIGDAELFIQMERSTDSGSTWSAISTTSFVAVENNDESVDFFGFISNLLDSGDQIRFRFARSSNGANDGSLTPVTPTPALQSAGFSTAPSATVAVYSQSNYPYRA